MKQKAKTYTYTCPLCGKKTKRLYYLSDEKYVCLTCISKITGQTPYDITHPDKRGGK
jgi:predicted SprT family Zn-dependent metalloprotease